MIDNKLFSVIRTELLSLLSTRGLSDVQIKRAYQPTQQSTGDKVITFHRISDPQVGFGLVYDDTTRTEERLKRATFQFTSYFQSNPEDVDGLTASDISITAADLLQSYSAIRNLRSNGVNIERVTAIRPSYFTNEKDRFETSPSFDLTINYVFTYESEISEVTEVNLNNFRV